MDSVCLCALGVAEILSAFFFGKIQDKWGYKMLIISSMLIFAISLAINFTFIAVFKFNIWGGALMCFFWGF